MVLRNRMKIPIYLFLSGALNGKINAIPKTNREATTESAQEVEKKLIQEPKLENRRAGGSLKDVVGSVRRIQRKLCIKYP